MLRGLGVVRLVLMFLYLGGIVGVGVLGGFGLVVGWGVALLYMLTRWGRSQFQERLTPSKERGDFEGGRVLWRGAFGRASVYYLRKQMSKKVEHVTSPQQWGLPGYASTERISAVSGWYQADRSLECGRIWEWLK